MNILFFSSDNDKASGAFLSMAKLVRFLKTIYGHNVYVVLSRKGDGQEILEEYGIEYYLIRSYNWIIKISDNKNIRKILELNLKMTLNKIAIIKCCHLIKQLKIDVIHINTTWTYIGAIAALKCRIPYVWHFREFLEEDQRVRIYSKKLGEYLFNRANRIICISNSIYNKYKTLINENKAIVIYNGIDETIFTDRKNKPFEKEKLQFIIIGTICESKGQWQLIEACGILKNKKITNFNVSVIGKGEDSYINKLKKRVIELDITSQVEFCGYIENVGDYYRKADITFICSKAEAFGRVTVEAMMSGSLVVGANTAATLELIEDKKTGLLYEAGNPQDLAKVIEWVLNNKDEAKIMAKNGMDFMKKNMTATINAKKINEVYYKLKTDYIQDR